MGTDNIMGSYSFPHPSTSYLIDKFITFVSHVVSVGMNEEG